MIGAPYASPNGLSGSGATYIVFGRSFNNKATSIGTSEGQTILATGGADVIVAGQGNDSITGVGSNDVVQAGQGNDSVTVNSLAFRQVDGGLGVDTLVFGGSGLLLDLRTTLPSKLTGVEVIDLSNSPNSQVIVNPRSVLNLAPLSNTLIVAGGSSNRVSLTGGWAESANQVDGGITYRVFLNGQATLRVEKQTPVSLAEFPLSFFTGTNGFVINGIDPNDKSGVSVGSAGDINGDGFDDFVIGADLGNPNGQSDAGEVYVIFGKGSGFSPSVNPAMLNGSDGFVINGIDSNDAAGFSVSSAGDINGDGLGDLIVGARFGDPNAQSNAGESYIIFGKSGGFSPILNLSTLDGANGFVINGIDPNDAAGFSVSSAGDINGDGFDDLIIGARYADPNGRGDAGESYVVFGKASGFTQSINLSMLNGTNGFVINGIDTADQSGRSVSSAGDINGDGFDDLIIGAPLAAPNGKVDAGESYVLFGKASGFSQSVNLSTLNGITGFVINGVETSDRSGASVSSAGDINGDGFDDLIIGAYQADPNGQLDAGASYVVFGKASGFTQSFNLSTLNGANGFLINGIDGADGSAWSVSGAGDVNGDGFDDLIIGALRGDPNGLSNAGESYVVFGKASGFGPILNLSTINGINGFVINGNRPSDLAGYSVSSAGDINGDGFDDLILGAPFADPNSQSAAGESYVIFGGNFSNLVSIQGTSAGETLNGSIGDDVIVAGQGNDTINGIGGQDVIYAGEGNDTVSFADSAFQRIDGGTGIDTLKIAAGTFDLSAFANNRITGFEIFDLASDPSTHRLLLSPLEVINLSDSSNELTIDRAEADSVLMGTGWTIEGTEERGGKNYFVYRAGAARLLVQVLGPLYGGMLQSNPNNPGLIDFVWTGAVGDNNVSFSFDPVNNSITQTVTKFDGVAVNSSTRFMGITGNVVLQGSAGKDVINASGLGDMSLLGRSAPTILSGGGGDSIVGSDGPDFISVDGAEGADSIFGNAGNDTIRSGGGADLVFGGDGNDDIVDGGEGRDTIDAGDGDDTVQAGDGRDSVIGGNGNDILIGDAKDTGRRDTDTLVGGAGRDILMGGLGADSLDGGTGEDLLIAGNHTAADLALNFIMLEWTSARTFAQRTANIAGTGVGARANGSNFLVRGSTVVNDNITGETPENIVDVVVGGSTAGEADWLWVDDPIDSRADFQVGVDLLTDLSL
jgi:hypothetical protein